MSLEGRDPNYEAGLISQLRLQGFSTEAIKLYLNKFAIDPSKRVDRDPSVSGSNVFNSEQIKGVTIFNWDTVIREIEEPKKTLYCDITKYTVNRNRIYNKTNVVGSKSSIKEYIADDDYQITIDGTFHNPVPDLVPVRSVNRLLEMTRHNGRIEVTNDFLNNSIGVFDVIIESYSFVQSEIGNIQSFRLETTSDLPDPQIN